MRVKPVRPALLGAFAAVLLALAGGTGIILLRGPEAEAASDALPLPPNVPRLASGPEYERCLSLLRSDPDEARTVAEAWAASGGGEGAQHCLALALLATGDARRAAERLEQLGRTGNGSPEARASVFGQAVQAWMLAGETGRAYAAATAVPL